MENRLEKILKKKELRKTLPRQNLFSILQESQNALSAKDICQRLQKKSKNNADPTSVYRNLTLFVQLGLVHRFPDGSYGLCQHNGEEHLRMHIMSHCVHCGRLEEIPDHHEKIYQMSRDLQNYMESFSYFSGLTLQGSCKDCCPEL